MLKPEEGNLPSIMAAAGGRIWMILTRPEGEPVFFGSDPVRADGDPETALSESRRLHGPAIAVELSAIGERVESRIVPIGDGPAWEPDGSELTCHVAIWPSGEMGFLSDPSADERAVSERINAVATVRSTLQANMNRRPYAESLPAAGAVLTLPRGLSGEVRWGSVEAGEELRINARDAEAILRVLARSASRTEVDAVLDIAFAGAPDEIIVRMGDVTEPFEPGSPRAVLDGMVSRAMIKTPALLADACREWGGPEARHPEALCCLLADAAGRIAEQKTAPEEPGM